MARDWSAIEAGYIAGASAPELAERFGVPLPTIQSKASRNKWGASRKAVASQVAAELPARVAEAVLDAAAQMTERHFAIYERGLARANEMFDDVEPVTDPETGDPLIHVAGDGTRIPVVRRIVQKPNHLRDLMAAAEKAVNGQRQARGLPDPKHDPHTTGGKGDAPSGVIELPSLGPEPEPPPDSEEEEDDPQP